MLDAFEVIWNFKTGSCQLAKVNTVIQLCEDARSGHALMNLLEFLQNLCDLDMASISWPSKANKDEMITYFSGEHDP